jgi:hypothetical protein
VIPHCPARLLRTHPETRPAANAFTFINYADVAIGGIHMSRAHRAASYADRFHALPAGINRKIIRKLPKRILDDLDSRERQILLSVMCQGAA